MIFIKTLHSRLICKLHDNIKYTSSNIFFFTSFKIISFYYFQYGLNEQFKFLFLKHFLFPSLLSHIVFFVHIRIFYLRFIASLAILTDVFSHELTSWCIYSTLLIRKVNSNNSQFYFPSVLFIHMYALTHIPTHVHIQVHIHFKLVACYRCCIFLFNIKFFSTGYYIMGIFPIT